MEAGVEWWRNGEDEWEIQESSYREVGKMSREDILLTQPLSQNSAII